MPSLTCRRLGFTLMELLAVMVVLSIALSITVGGMQGLMPGSRLESGARELSTRIDELRHEAIARGWYVTIEYDLDRNAYRAWGTAPPGKARELLADPDGRIWLAGEPGKGEDFIWKEFARDVDLVAIEQVDGQRVEVGRVQVEINPFGIVDAHAVQIHSTSIDYWYTILVNSLHGLSDLVEGRQELAIREDSQF